MNLLFTFWHVVGSTGLGEGNGELEFLGFNDISSGKLEFLLGVNDGPLISTITNN